MLTVAANMLKCYAASISTLVARFDGDYTQQCAGCTTYGNDTKRILVYCKSYHMEMSPTKKICTKVSGKEFCSSVQQKLYMVANCLYRQGRRQKTLLLHFKPCQREVLSRQNIRRSYSGKISTRIVLPWIHFHTVKLTVFRRIQTLFVAIRTESVPMVKKARTEDDGACKLDGNGTRTVYLLTVSSTIWLSCRGKNFGPKLFAFYLIP